ncbi:DNA gyrase inhibitor YacG [Chitinivorax sp. B]|uniref:DNA gyrase inhibitor YacG n=1 Tax=Chitinivorax sp. B TaxID=2502235 RepID=UPI0014855651|nr:DNA gyrase inhibitor YacG [Chitinivorax sp. B]
MSETSIPRQVPCPNCRTLTAWVLENKYRPFCSERCRLIDLGQWANEQYRIPCKDEVATDGNNLN